MGRKCQLRIGGYTEEYCKTEAVWLALSKGACAGAPADSRRRRHLEPRYPLGRHVRARRSAINSSRSVRRDGSLHRLSHCRGSFRRS